MLRWAGAAVALRDPDADPLQSRLPVHLHPLAGRVLVWHPLRALAAQEPTPESIVLLCRVEFDAAMLDALPVDVVAADEDRWVRTLLDAVPDVGWYLLMDAAAPGLDRSLSALIGSAVPAVLRAADGSTLALWCHRSRLADAAPGATLDDLAAGAVEIDDAPAERVLVRDRAGLSAAHAVVRDRLLARLMEHGVTFLLPETVLVDVDVQIGRDTIVYPNVVLEGKTSIGAETVIGPGCRIIDTIVGSGVELKGYNYLVDTTIRNRAVLEPYVRRGFD